MFRIASSLIMLTVLLQGVRSENAETSLESKDTGNIMSGMPFIDVQNTLKTPTEHNDQKTQTKSGVLDTNSQGQNQSAEHKPEKVQQKEVQDKLKPKPTDIHTTSKVDVVQQPPRVQVKEIADTTPQQAVDKSQTDKDQVKNQQSQTTNPENIKPKDEATPKRNPQDSRMQSTSPESDKGVILWSKDAQSPEVKARQFNLKLISNTDTTGELIGGPSQKQNEQQDSVAETKQSTTPSVPPIGPQPQKPNVTEVTGNVNADTPLTEVDQPKTQTQKTENPKPKEGLAQQQSTPDAKPVEVKQQSTQDNTHQVRVVQVANISQERNQQPKAGSQTQSPPTEEQYMPVQNFQPGSRFKPQDSPVITRKDLAKPSQQVLPRQFFGESIPQSQLDNPATRPQLPPVQPKVPQPQKTADQLPKSGNQLPTAPTKKQLRQEPPLNTVTVPKPILADQELQNFMMYKNTILILCTAIIVIVAIARVLSCCCESSPHPGHSMIRRDEDRQVLRHSQAQILEEPPEVTEDFINISEEDD